MVQTDDHEINCLTLGDLPTQSSFCFANNAAALQVDLGCVRNIVLSHFHFDHTSLASVIQNTRQPYAGQLDVYVGAGFFIPRVIDMRHPAGAMGAKIFGATSVNFMQEKRTQLEALGLAFQEISQPTQITKGVWATGPVPRVYPEQKISSTGCCCKNRMATPRPDNVPDSAGWS